MAPVLGSRRSVLRGGAAALILLLTGCVSGCAAPNEDLTKALEQTRASVHTVQLALNALDQQQATLALARVAASDAADEITIAQKHAGDVPAPTPEDRAARAQTLAAIGTSRVVVLDAADELADGGDLQLVGQDLDRADASLAAALSALGSR